MSDAGNPNEKGTEDDEKAGMSTLARVWVEAAPYLDLGWVFVASIVAFGGIGHWLDGRLSTRPYLLLAGCLLGIAGGFVHFFRVVLVRNREKKR